MKLYKWREGNIYMSANHPSEFKECVIIREGDLVLLLSINDDNSIKFYHFRAGRIIYDHKDLLHIDYKEVS